MSGIIFSIFLKINYKQKLSLTSSFKYKDIIVPKGFSFDGNTVPRWARFFIGQYEYIQASCIHDYLYNKDTNYLNISRYEADNIYKVMLIDMGFDKYKAMVCYYLIRLIGFRRFRK